METMKKGNKITIGDLELWTAPFGTTKATITALEAGTKQLLLNLHKTIPEAFELFVDDEDFCEEDMDGAFSVVVDPQIVNLLIEPGTGKLFFRVARDCEDCPCNGCEACEAEEDTNE